MTASVRGAGVRFIAAADPAGDRADVSARSLPACRPPACRRGRAFVPDGPGMVATVMEGDVSSRVQLHVVDGAHDRIDRFAVAAERERQAFVEDQGRQRVGRAGVDDAPFLPRRLAASQQGDEPGLGQVAEGQASVVLFQMSTTRVPTSLTRKSSASTSARTTCGSRERRSAGSMRGRVLDAGGCDGTDHLDS